MSITAPAITTFVRAPASLARRGSRAAGPSVAIIAGALLSVAGCLTTGCATAPAEPRPLTDADFAGSPRWEGVFLPPTTHAAVADAYPEDMPWYNRNDWQLNQRLSEPLAYEDRPTLDNSRTITIRNQPDTVIYFNPPWHHW